MSKPLSSPFRQLGYLTTASDSADLPSLWSGADATGLTPSDRLRVLEAHQRELEPTWLDRVGPGIAAMIGRARRNLPRLRAIAQTVLARQPHYAALEAEAFAEALAACAATSRQTYNPAIRDLGPADLEGLAAAAEAVRRVHGFLPHPEQLMGAVALLEGRMAEMATGEGKTITAAIAAIVAAWRGLPCHVVTANDYLAQRDSDLGQALFAQCGVTAAAVTGDTPPEGRRGGYRHDIVYTTAKDFLADHLRDQIALGQRGFRVRFALAAARQGGAGDLPEVTTRGLYQVIVDEADSVLIDEAVTPLIISFQRPDDLLEEAAKEAVRLARSLLPDTDYRVRPMLRDVQLTPAGKERLHQLTRALGRFWRRQDRAEELVQMALYADNLMLRDRHFIIEDDKVVLIDELTGRLARQRTLSLGMHQVLEACHDLEISPLSEVRARQSFQRFFRRFHRLGGMTGTAREARGEFAKAYGLTTVAIPTHRAVRRQHWPLQVFDTEAEKFAAIVREAADLAAQGRAVLIGVRSVRASDALFELFCASRPDLAVEKLNAVNNSRESVIVAAAGQPGGLTIATNLAGRGTDIALHESVRETGGLHVIIAESNDFARIDRQLIGRCARQGDPGTYRRFVSMDEEVITRFLPKAVQGIWRAQRRILPRLAEATASLMVLIAQDRAARVAFRQRLQTVKADIEIDKVGI